MTIKYELSTTELENILKLLRGICDISGVKDSVSNAAFDRLHKRYCK